MYIYFFLSILVVSTLDCCA